MRKRHQGSLVINGINNVLPINGDSVAAANQVNLIGVTLQVVTALQNIQIGREIKDIRDDLFACRAHFERGHGQFKQIYRGRIADHNFAFRSSDQLRKFIAHFRGGSKPFFAPGADQPGAPFFFDQTFHVLDGFNWQTPKRIAIHIDHVIIGLEEL